MFFLLVGEFDYVGHVDFDARHFSYVSISGLFMHLFQAFNFCMKHQFSRGPKVANPKLIKKSALFPENFLSFLSVYYKG